MGLDEPIDATLRDGARVRLRRIRPDDKDALRAGFDRLSDGARSRRFLGAINRLTDEQLVYLTEVDHHDHIAWVVGRPQDMTEGIAVGRCVRLADGAVAEVAMAVADAWQGRGVGRVLLSVLARDARANGISTLRAVMQPDNRVMQGLLADFGAPPGRFVDGVVEVDLPLGAAGA